MGKLEQLAEGRMQGMAFALKVCKDAEKNGDDPIKALEKEMSFRYKTRISIMATQKELDRATDTIKELTAKTMLSASLIVLWEQFHFGNVRAERFSRAFMTYVKALCNGEITWFDIADTLKEKTGIEVFFDDEVFIRIGDKK